jgi:integrase
VTTTTTSGGLELIQEYRDFIDSIKSEATAKAYSNALAHYMKFLNITDIRSLLQNDNKAIERQLIDYIRSMRNNTPYPISYSLRQLRFSAVKKFYVMNDVTLNWRKISMYLGENIKVIKDRAYSTSEIQRLLSCCSEERMRAVVLLLASTGMRVGALPSLKMKHITKIDEYNIYQITLYENTKEEHYCFCTPECATSMQNYFTFRENCGERLGPESPLIREQFDREDLGRIRNSRHITKDAIVNNLSTVILKSGVQKRKLITETGVAGRERKDTARAHAFRKFATTNMIRAKVDPQAREMLLGHSIGLSSSYYRPNSQEILDEYLKAVDLLTVDEANRLKRKVNEMEIQHSKEFEEMKQWMQEEEAQIEKMLIESNERHEKYERQRRDQEAAAAADLAKNKHSRVSKTKSKEVEVFDMTEGKWIRYRRLSDRSPS